MVEEKANELPNGLSCQSSVLVRSELLLTWRSSHSMVRNSLTNVGNRDVQSTLLLWLARLVLLLPGPAHPSPQRTPCRLRFVILEVPGEKDAIGLHRRI